jgi:SAM-dependent methyltransferase
MNYYDLCADKFCASTFDLDLNHITEKFLKYIPDGGKILDAGCGSGRDSCSYKKKGYVVDAFDSSASMAKIASQNIGQEVKCISFQEIKYDSIFDGIWACASLLHVKRCDLVYVLGLLRAALVPTGCIYASFKLGDEEREDGHGRYFNDLNEELLEKILKNCNGLISREVWITQDARPGRDEEYWLNAIIMRYS